MIAGESEETENQNSAEKFPAKGDEENAIGFAN